MPRAAALPDRPTVLSFRSLFAGLVLAVVPLGGVGAPLVHEVAHAAERAAARATHVADGHHTADGAPRAGETCPLPGADLACTLCHGLAAAVVAEAVPARDATPDAAPERTAPRRGPDARIATATGRGPPVA